MLGFKDSIQFLPRGRGLGGSHQLNYLLHFSGIKEDFERWEGLGADGWDYERLKKFLNRHDSPSDVSRDDMPKLSITSIESEYSQFNEALIKALVKAENDMQKTFNPNVTLNLAKFTSKNGIRSTVFHDYLRKAYKLKNLSIMLYAKVEKIEFNEKEAVSVIVRTKSHSTTRIYAKREIILSAGAFHTPHLLKLSGVGKKEELKSAGIDVIEENPSVGMNLFDHINMPLYVSINSSASVTVKKILSSSEILNFLINGKGAYSNTGVVGLMRLDDYGVILFGVGSIHEKTLKHVANYKTTSFRAFFPLHANISQEGFVALNACLLPKSRGDVKLRLKDIYSDPLINPNYLKNKKDIVCIRNAIKMTFKMISTKKFRKINATIHWPFLTACNNFGPFNRSSETMMPSNRYIDCIIEHGSLTFNHPHGTCAIGKAIDSNLR